MRINIVAFAFLILRSTLLHKKFTSPSRFALLCFLLINQLNIFSLLRKFGYLPWFDWSICFLVCVCVELGARNRLGIECPIYNCVASATSISQLLSRLITVVRPRAYLIDFCSRLFPPAMAKLSGLSALCVTVLVSALLSSVVTVSSFWVVRMRKSKVITKQLTHQLGVLSKTG